MIKKDREDNRIRPVAEASEELEELERYIEELSTFLPLPFCIANPSGIILNINKAFCDLIGYGELEIVGERIARVFGSEKDALALESKIFQANVVKNQEMILVTKGKKEIIANVSGALRKDRENNAIGYFLAFSDISELKRLQLELEKKVEERTSQLKEKIDELEKFNRLAIGRELKMVELKQEIEKLKNEMERLKKTQYV